jgi:hypothetical protein
MDMRRLYSGPRLLVGAAVGLTAAVAFGLAATAFAAKQPPQSPLKVTISPTTAVAGSTNNAFTVKVTAGSSISGQYKLVIPAGWTAPQASNSTLPGYMVIQKLTCSSAGPFPASITGSGPWTVLINFTCGTNKNFSVTYGGSVASSKVTAPQTATSYEFTSESSIPVGSAFQRLTTQPVVTVTPNPVHFEITGLPSSVVAGAANAFTVTARNASNAIVTSYAGAVKFTSSDGGATLPVNYAFTAGDAGSHTFTPGATFVTLGSRSLTVTDISNAGVTGSATTTVGPGPATHLVVSGLADPSTAGAAQSVTVTAKDALNNTATGYTGTIHFTSSDGAATLPANYTFTAGDAGAHTFTGAVTLRTAGSRSVSATDTANASNNGSQTVTVNAGAATHFAVSAPSSATAGSAFSFTATALDQFDNTATGYAGTVHFTSGDGQAVLPADATLTNGTGTFSATLKTAGPRTITATDTANASITGTSNTITVDAAAADHLDVSGPGPVTAGTAFNVTVTARDAFNNTATGYGDTVQFSSSDVIATLPADSTLTAGSDTFSVTLNTVGQQTVVATDTANASITGQANVLVAAGAATHFDVSGLADPSAPGVAQDVTVTAKDASDNTATGYTGTIHFSSSDGGAVLPSDYEFTAGDGGTHSFTGGVTLNSAGSQDVTATDTADSGITGSQSVTVDDTLYVDTVTGADANVGSKAAPLKTINAAVTKTGSFTGVHTLHVAQGSYNEGGGVALVDGIQISGGYAADWTQTGTATTIVGVVQSVLADGDTGVSIDHVMLAPIVPGGVLGASVYGLRAINGSSVTLQTVAITTPNANTGQPGATGGSVPFGDQGQPGQSAIDDSCAAPSGLGGAGGVDFTAGGDGSNGSCGTAFSGSPGSGPGGGNGGFGGLCCSGGNGGTGSSGGIGSAGTNGTGGSPLVDLAADTWLGHAGADGTNGGVGSGGGGGGGGGARDCGVFCFANRGGGGGGGGGGGFGGEGAGGGLPGGGSFGVYLWNSTAVVNGSTLTIGHGGNGGASGLRGNGGAGGPGGFGGSGANGGGHGGSGGSGGPGGPGGHGGGGAGGPSIGIFRGGTSTASGTVGSITLGGGGNGGNSPAGGAATGAPGFTAGVF